MEVSDKLAKMEAEKHSLLSDLTIMSALKAQSDHELSIVKEQQSEEKESRESVEGQLRTVKQQLQEVTDSNEGLQRELAAVVDSHKSLNESTKCQIEDLEGQVTSLQDDKSSLEGEIEVARQQLEAANEARIRAEQANVRAQEQLQSVQCMMDQEVAALEFQLSSETMKYETELKVSARTFGRHKTVFALKGHRGNTLFCRAANSIQFESAATAQNDEFKGSFHNSYSRFLLNVKT